MSLRQILVSALAAFLLAACGQKGPLQLPTSPAAAGRATLPETLNPSNNVTPAPVPAAPASAPPATGTASPVRQP